MKRFVLPTCIFLFALIPIIVFGAPKPAPKVFTNKLIKTEINQTLFYPTTILSKVDSKIKADSDLVVIKSLVKLGQTVKKGERLLLVKSQDTSSFYQNRALRAQVDGVVSSIKVRQGQYISRGEQLVGINDPSKLYAQIEVPVAEVKNLKPGQVVSIDLASLGIKKIKGTVSAIGATADFATATVSTEINLAESSIKNLIAGVHGTAEVTLDKKDLLLVNENSLYYVGEEVFLPTLNDGKIKKIPVTIGKRYKDKVELLEGVNLNQEYITESPSFLKDGSTVEVIKKK